MSLLGRVFLTIVFSLVVLLVPLTAVAIHGVPPPDRSTVAVVGCEPVQVRRLPATTGATLDATTDGCRGIPDPSRRVARAVWNSTYDVTEIRIRTAGPASPTTVLPRAELERRYGARPRPEFHPGDLLWLLLPLTLIVPLAVAVVVLRQTSRAGAVLVVVRR